MTTYFISDLHLCEQQPHISRLFIQFCRNKACHAQALYILGDLFEYWLGDDAIAPTGDQTALLVQEELSTLTAQGVKVYFMAGNRDFLVGDEYAEKCGMQIIAEPTVIKLNNKPVLLIHGDAQCTDDEPYQQVRIMLRSSAWQQQFLSKALPERIEFANQARQQSQQHTSKTDTDIMDVNQNAIAALFHKYQVNTMIHGHTHRPAIHKFGDTTRIVLGDWHHQSSYLEVDKKGMQLISI